VKVFSLAALLCFTVLWCLNSLYADGELLPEQLAPVFNGAIPFVLSIALSIVSLSLELFKGGQPLSALQDTPSINISSEPVSKTGIDTIATELVKQELIEKNEILESTITQLQNTQSELEKRLGEADVKITELQKALSIAQNETLKLSEKQTATNQGTALVDAEVVNLLGLLQSKGRFIDFVMEDISSVQDNAIGAAARVVHQGCKSIMSQYFTVLPIHEAKEGETIKISTAKGDTPDGQIRVIGRGKAEDSANGNSEKQGKLLHKGWKVSEIRLPRIQVLPDTERQLVIAPAEIELI
jgi:hypothetical protein